MNGLQQDDVILGLEGEVLGGDSRQLQLDHELVVGGGHLEPKVNSFILVRLATDPRMLSAARPSWKYQLSLNHRNSTALDSYTACMGDRMATLGAAGPGSNLCPA